jgi:uncharacterized membrane protein
MKKKLKGYEANLLFALSVFIIFLLAFANTIRVPNWFRPIGRLHPMLLHFPIVILLAAVCLNFFHLKDDQKATHSLNELTRVLFFAGAFSAGITVVMGLLLSNEKGYQGNTLQWHKWSGAGVFFLSYSIFLARDHTWFRTLVARIFSSLTFAFIMISGHYGAALTHGENFVFETVTPKEIISMDKAVLFDHVLKPVFDSKCRTCHNEEKRKGNLVLTDTTSIITGGKSGPLFIQGKPGESLLLERLNLPPDNRKHMPPIGKEQLSEEEMNLFKYWVGSGMALNTKITDLRSGDSLSIAVQTILKSSGVVAESFHFPAASEETIRNLNTNYRFVVPLAKGSPALAVNFYGRSSYNAAAVIELRAVKEQIISLNLDKMPAKNDDLRAIGEFTNLQTLNLNFTEITGQGLKYLAPLKHLRSISVSGVKINYTDLQQHIRTLRNLFSIALWNTGLSDKEIQQLRHDNPKIRFIEGFNEKESAPVRLNKPQLENASSVFNESLSVELKHPVKDARIRYTLDGSEPDSVRSPLYEKSILVRQNTIIKAIASKPGWLVSDVATFEFYKRLLLPDSTVILTPLYDRFIASGASTLFDGQLGSLSIFSNKWLGTSVNSMDVLMSFKKAVSLESVALHILCSPPESVFPPSRIEVWGGNTPQRLRLLSTLIPDQPGSRIKSSMLILKCSFNKQSLIYIKLVARPVLKLPPWHDKKGLPAVLMADEIFIN